MISEKHNNLAKNLQNLRKARKISLAEFSKELDIPKSTLQSILEDGQTSLHTAMRISEKLGIPLDTLVSGVLSCSQMELLEGLMFQLDWFDRLPKHKQEEASEHIRALILMIQESEVMLR